MDDFTFNFGDDREDGSEEGEWQWGGRNATVFVIDTAPQMFKKNTEITQGEDQPEAPFVTALKCVHASVCRAVISSDQDLTAVVFFNTRHGGGGTTTTSTTIMDNTYPHIAVMQPLERPSADRVLALEAFIKGGCSSVCRQFGGVTEAASLSDALWACSNLITQCKSKLAGQHVLLFTCRDEPHRGGDNTDHRDRQAIVKARDLNDADIDFELLPLGPAFNMELFYKSLLTLGGDAPERAPVAATAAARLEQLQERVRRLEHKQRTTGRVPFTVAPGLTISVGLYTGIRKALKPSRQKLYKVTNEEVRSMTKEFLEETGELLMPSDFVKYHTYANKRIKFTLDETRQMSRVFPAGVEVLGFKPLTALKPYLYIRPACFLYPDEKDIKGSCAVFAALLARCTARGVVAIARVVPRANAGPSWAALTPQEEVVDEDGIQLSPPGFYVNFLPFADDFRQLPPQEHSDGGGASTAAVDAAKAVIKKLHFRYDPASFENPDLQTHWRNIEALALNRTELEVVTDYTVPDYERIARKTAALMTTFKQTVFPPGYDPKAVKKPIRPASTPAARRAPAPPAASMSVEDLARENKVEKLPMAALKAWLTARGLRVAAGKKKNELVQDVYDALAS